MRVESNLMLGRTEKIEINGLIIVYFNIWPAKILEVSNCIQGFLTTKIAKK